MRHSLWGIYQHTHPRQSSPRNGVFHTKARCILFPSKPTLAEKDFRQCIQDCRMEKPTFSDLRLIRVSGHWYRWIGIEKQELWFLNQNSCLAATFTAIFNLVYTIVPKSASENIMFHVTGQVFQSLANLFALSRLHSGNLLRGLVMHPALLINPRRPFARAV